MVKNKMSELTLMFFAYLFIPIGLAMHLERNLCHLITTGRPSPAFSPIRSALAGTCRRYLLARRHFEKVAANERTI